ncbi:MAG: alpha/beta hydrolase [Acidimicrobiales bacterium]
MTNPIHPDLRRLAPFIPRGPVSERSVPALRALQSGATALAGLAQRRRGGPVSVEMQQAGSASLRVHLPSSGGAGPHAALLWIHGGGYVIGNAAQEDAFCRFVSRRLGIVVASVEYRLAPEHPFPAPLHDCHDALVALAGRDDVDRSRIVVGGASAGGGLAAGLAALAVERGEVAPILQLLSYPMLDDRTVLRTGIDERHFRLWNNRSNRFGWESYLGREPGSSDVPGLAAPARLDDLADLPPAWIGVGTLDLFHDEDLAYAARLRLAGVPCEVTVVDGAFHGFDGVSPRSGVAASYREAMVAAITVALAERSDA